jgi:hypothetical protein
MKLFSFSPDWFTKFDDTKGLAMDNSKWKFEKEATELPQIRAK